MLHLFQSFYGSAKSKLVSEDQVTSGAAVTDHLFYPRVLDPVRTGRGYAKANQAVLPFFPNRDFLGSDMKTLRTVDYQKAYGYMKRTLEIETTRVDKMDPYLVNRRNNFVGDYHTPYPNMVEVMSESFSKLLSQREKQTGRKHGRQNSKGTY